MLIPNTNRNQLSKEMLMERWKALANDGHQVIQEGSKGTSSRATLMHKVKGADGLTYGILQENTHFFLKKTTAAFDTAQSADFEYIGGTQNILAERFSSASDAHRRLNAKLWSLRESVDAPQSSEEDLLSKLNQKDDEEAQAPAEDGEMPAEGGAEADPLAGLDGAAPAEGGGEADPLAGLDDAAPAEDGGEGAAPADGGAEGDPLAGLDDAAPAADGGGEGAAPVEDGAADDLGLDADGGEAAPAEDGGEAAPDAEGGEDSSSEAQTKLGQLAQMMKVDANLSPDFLVAALNTLITVGDRVFPQIPQDDKDKLTQRIAKDGKKIDEDETPRSLSAAHQNSAAEHRKNVSDPKQGYRNSEIANAKDDLEGSAHYRSQAKPLPEGEDEAVAGLEETANWLQALNEKFNPNQQLSNDDYAKQRQRERQQVGARSTNAPNSRNHVAAAQNQAGDQRRGIASNPQASAQYNKAAGNNAMTQAKTSRLAHQDANPQQLPEAYDDANDSAYHNNERNMGNEQGNVLGFYEFMENGGFSNKDEDVIKGIEAFSKMLWERDAQVTDQDLQEMAKDMNPFIWSSISNVSEDIINGLAKVGGVNMELDGEWPMSTQTGQALVNPQTPPLNESWGSVATLTRLLVRQEIKKSKI